MMDDEKIRKGRWIWLLLFGAAVFCYCWAHETAWRSAWGGNICLVNGDQYLSITRHHWVWSGPTTHFELYDSDGSWRRSAVLQGNFYIAPQPLESGNFALVIQRKSLPDELVVFDPKQLRVVRSKKYPMRLHTLNVRRKGSEDRIVFGTEKFNQLACVSVNEKLEDEQNLPDARFGRMYSNDGMLETVYDGTPAKQELSYGVDVAWCVADRDLRLTQLRSSAGGGISIMDGTSQRAHWTESELKKSHVACREFPIVGYFGIGPHAIRTANLSADSMSAPITLKNPRIAVGACIVACLAVMTSALMLPILDSATRILRVSMVLTYIFHLSVFLLSGIGVQPVWLELILPVLAMASSFEHLVASPPSNLRTLLIQTIMILSCFWVIMHNPSLASHEFEGLISDSALTCIAIMLVTVLCKDLRLQFQFHFLDVALWTTLAGMLIMLILTENSGLFLSAYERPIFAVASLFPIAACVGWMMMFFPDKTSIRGKRWKLGLLASLVVIGLVAAQLTNSYPFKIVWPFSRLYSARVVSLGIGLAFVTFYGLVRIALRRSIRSKEKLTPIN